MFENSRFVTTTRKSSRKTALTLPILVSISVFRLPSLVHTTPRCSTFSTCCSVLPLTCSVHCLGFLESHNTSVFLVLIFIPARLHAAESRLSACWKPCWENESSTKPAAKSKWIDPAAPNCGTFDNSAVIVYTIHVVDYEEEWWQNTPLSESNTNDERFWFNSSNMDTHFWTGIQWFDSQ